jgi:Ca2+-binding EF-hand superfamily protein
MSVSPVGNMVPAHTTTGASPRLPPQQKMSNLFNRIDTTGSGSISQAQFSQAFQTMNPPSVFKAQGANAIWTQLDPNNSGSVSQADFVNIMKGLMASLRAPSSQA